MTKQTSNSLTYPLTASKQTNKQTKTLCANTTSVIWDNLSTKDVGSLLRQYEIIIFKQIPSIWADNMFSNK